MKYRFGTLLFNEGEIQLDSVTEKQTRTPEGMPGLLEITHSLSGAVLGSGATRLERSASISARMGVIKGALQNVAADFGLIDDAGNPTIHYIQGQYAVSGVRVDGLTWGGGDVGPEYSVYRTFSFQVSIVTLAGSTPAIWERKETIAITGTGGPRFLTLELDSGLPIVQQVSTNTPVRATQSGTIVGTSGWPVAPLPALNGEQSWLRKVDRQTPTSLGPGDNRIYPTSYSYSFEAVSLAALTAPNPYEPVFT